MSNRFTAPGPIHFRASRYALVSGLLAGCVAATGWASPAGAESIPAPGQQELTGIIVKRDHGLNAAERADIRADAGVDLVRRLALPDAELVAAAPGDLAEALAALRDDPDVAYAEPDALITSAAVDPWWGEQWALENVGQQIGSSVGSVDADVDAPDAWRTSTGSGVTVAVIDSGIESGHPDLAGRVAGNPGESGALAANGVDDDANGFVDDFRGWDWIGERNSVDDGNPATPEDEDNSPGDTLGHGTHVSGIIAAQRDNSIGIAGIAPDARVLPLRVLDGSNRGYMSDAAEALHYAGEAGVRVANASLGLKSTLETVRSLREAIAAHPRTLYVLAAGNAGADNDAEPFYPCALPEANIVCVGASDNADRPATFSNHGTRSVDLFAPGQAIRSTYIGGRYETMDGTSMAAPLVAGTAALVAAAHSSLDAAGLKRRVLDGADRGDTFARSVTGARLNAATAVGRPAIVAPVTTPAPEPVTPAPTPAAPQPAPAPPAPAVAPAPAPAPAAPAATPVSPVSPAAATVPIAPAPAATTRTPAPRLSRLALSSRRLRRTVTVSFELDRPATIALTLSRKVCRGARCSYRVAQTLTIRGRAGANRQSLRRSVRGRRLPKGSYRLTAQAFDGSSRSALSRTTLSVS